MKAILEMEMPKTCSVCMLSAFLGPINRRVCFAAEHISSSPEDSGISRHVLCPLKPKPEEKPDCTVNQAAIEAANADIEQLRKQVGWLSRKIANSRETISNNARTAMSTALKESCCPPRTSCPGIGTACHSCWSSASKIAVEVGG